MFVPRNHVFVQVALNPYRVPVGVLFELVTCCSRVYVRADRSKSVMFLGCSLVSDCLVLPTIRKLFFSGRIETKWRCPLPKLDEAA